MAAASRYTEVRRRTQEVTAWVDDGPPEPTVPNDSLSLSAEAKAQEAQRGADVSGVNEAVLKDPETELIRLLVEAFTGKKIRILTAEDLESLRKRLEALEAEIPVSQPQREGWGLIINTHETYREEQEMSFAAEGVIKTKDGKEIRFDLRLAASREFMQETNLTIRAGDAAKKAVDPLVINFNGLASSLTSATFAFDLDNNGKNENIHFVQPGSGFLALDLNGDGKVTSGAELFGPATGNGLEELAAHDVDKNQWIDESDPVYDKLLVWSKDAQGNDSLMTLRSAGVGALHLGYVDASYSLKDQANNTTGQTTRLGVYVNENGTVGSLQQIDLVV